MGSRSDRDVIRTIQRFFYKYRGVEKIAEGQPVDRVLLLAERFSGTAAFAHGLAFRSGRDPHDPAVLLQISRRREDRRRPAGRSRAAAGGTLFRHCRLRAWARVPIGT